MAIEREARSTVVGAKVTPSLKLALREAAKDEHRTIGSMMERILADWLACNGYLDRSIVFAN